MTATALPPLETAARAERVRESFEDFDALLVSDLTNIRWLTGFTGSNGWVVLSGDDLVLITDGRYGVQAQQQLEAAGVSGRVLVGLSGAATLDHIAAECNLHAAVGFEAAHVTFQQHRSYEAEVTARLVPTAGVVEAHRRSKDAGEIARMAEACRIADAALADVAPRLSDGLTEAQVRNLLEIRMRELGATGPSYETIVATGGVNAALPHHRPTDTTIVPGDTVIIDVGALFDGYHSDMTRSFVIGEPTALQTELYAVVHAAQTAGVAAARPGITSRGLDAVCRDVIIDAGYGEWFSHGTGHGVGLLIHEDPFINAVGTVELGVGDVVTVEPGVYRGGFGGFRIEDLVVVTTDGCRVLTSSPKDSPCPQSPPTT
jgi:Xaa-Pro aminopeptidase